MSAAPLLQVSGLERSFVGGGTRFTLYVAHLELLAGTQLAVVGPSGCGKSTLLGLLAMALRPDAGATMLLEGTDVLDLWRHNRVDTLTRLRAARIGFVPQTAALLPFLSLGANIALPQRLGGLDEPDYLRALAKVLGIDHILGRRPGEVSVGQRQRAAVARALAHRPRLLLADEPTASVHPTQAAEIMALLTSVTVELGTALVIATHDIDAAAAAGCSIAACQPDATANASSFAWPV